MCLFVYLFCLFFFVSTQNNFDLLFLLYVRTTVKMNILTCDCLELIFTMLCIVDMVQLSRTNKKMNDVFKQVVSLCLKPHKSLAPIWHSINPNNIESLFSLSDFEFDRLMIDIDVLDLPNISSDMERIGKLNMHKKSRLYIHDRWESVDFAPHMKHLVGIHKLKLHGNVTNVHDDLIQQQLSTIPSLIFIQVNNLNLTRFTSLESFSLISSNISDVHELKNIRTLNLSGCKNITDVSMLGNVYDLDLSYTNVFDVSMLGRVHKLDLSNTKVKDVSMLGNVYDLNLYGCVIAEGLDMLINVHKLNLSYMNIDKIGMFKNIHDLNLTGHTYFEDLHTLKSVHTLTLKNSIINDFNMLGDNYKLDLSGSNVIDVSNLSNVHTLDLSSTQVKDVSMLGRVHTLNLRYTPVKNVSNLGNVHTLDLSSTRVEDVSMLGRVHTLILRDTMIQSVKGLENVHTLDLTYTPINVEVARTLTGVKVLKHRDLRR